jgi:hypothetical protein
MNRMNDTPQGPTDQEILEKGKRFTVHFEEPFDGQTSEEVLIGFIKTKDVNKPQLQAPESDPAAFVAHVCGKGQAWGEALTLDSVMEAMEHAERINRRFFGLLAKRAKAMENLPPHLLDRMISIGERVQADDAPNHRLGRVLPRGR